MKCFLLNYFAEEALQSLATKESPRLILAMMYDQPGSREPLSNKLLPLEQTESKQVLKGRCVNSFLTDKLDKCGRNKCAKCKS